MPYTEMYQCTMENDPTYISPIVENIGDIRWIVDIVKSTKMKYFLVSGNLLYGTDDEGCVLTKVQLPQTFNSIFRFSLVDLADAKDTFANYNNFIYIPGFAIIPSDLYGSYLDHTLQFDYVNRVVSYPLGDTLERAPVILIDIMSAMYPKTNIIVQVLNAYDNNVCPYLVDPIMFSELEKDQSILDTLQTKSSDGMHVARFNKDNKIYFITLFKSLIPINKSDTLSLVIMDDVRFPNSFLARFILVKKKPRVSIEINLLCINPI